MWRRILYVVGLLFILGYLYFSEKHTKARTTGKTCAGIDIKITGDGDSGADTTGNNVFSLMGVSRRTLESCLIDTLNTTVLSNKIKRQSYVKRADIYKTISGVLKIDITYRSPLIRIINNYGESFYIDEDGFVMKPPSGFYSHVLIASGNVSYRPGNTSVLISDTAIYNKPGVKTLRDLHSVANYIKNSKFWSAQVQQVYVAGSGDIEIIPRVGSQVIEMGDANDIDIKFKRLMAFYKKGLPVLGWNKYDKINVKYKGQIICTPKKVL